MWEYTVGFIGAVLVALNLPLIWTDPPRRKRR